MEINVVNLDVFEEIKSIMVRLFQCADSEITEGASASDIDQWDSLEHVSLILEIEKEFNIKFALGELQNLKNVKGLVDLVESKLKHEG